MYNSYQYNIGLLQGCTTYKLFRGYLSQKNSFQEKEMADKEHSKQGNYNINYTNI